MIKDSDALQVCHHALQMQLTGGARVSTLGIKVIGHQSSTSLVHSLFRESPMAPLPQRFLGDAQQALTSTLDKAVAALLKSDVAGLLAHLNI